MTHYSEERTANPTRYYANPQGVLNDARLSEADKEKVLQSMVADAEQRAEAVIEGMSNPDPVAPTLELQLALETLRKVREKSAQNAAKPSHSRFQRILVIMTENEDLNQTVAGVADDLAKAGGGKTRWLSVNRPKVAAAQFAAAGPMASVAIVPTVDDSERKEMIEAREEELLDLKAENFPKSDTEIEVRDGEMELEILDRAEGWNADIIVLGAPNRSWLETIFMPSAVQSVTKAAACPVLVVPEPQ